MLSAIMLRAIVVGILLWWVSLCWVSLCRLSCFIYCYSECNDSEFRNAESHYAECHYAECRGARETDNPKNVGSNPTIAGTRWKGQKSIWQNVRLTKCPGTKQLGKMWYWERCCGTVADCLKKTAKQNDLGFVPYLLLSHRQTQDMQWA